MNKRENRLFKAKVIGGVGLGFLGVGATWLFFALLSLCVSGAVLCGAVYLVITVLRMMGVAI